MPFVLANIFQPLIDFFESIMKWLHDSGGFSWGTSIVILTIIVRAALVPLTLKQFKSMQAMQRLAPEIKALQEKYKDDKQRQQQEMMAFYKENQVNPFGSCLPLVLQLPVFLSLFYMLRKDLRFDICPATQAAHGAPPANPVPCGHTPESQFLFIPDITNKATGAVLVVLIVLYIGSQLASSILMSSATADRNQRMLMIGLPFIFVTFIVRFPAGLIVYWITTNVWTIGQQYVVRRTLGPMRPATAPAGAAAAVSGGNGKGGKPPPEAKRKEPEKDQVAAKPRRESAPPPPPRRKKKRSGRRR